MSDDLREHIAGLDIQEIRLVNGDHILAEVLWDRESPEMVIKDPIKLGIDKNVNLFLCKFYIIKF